MPYRIPVWGALLIVLWMSPAAPQFLGAPPGGSTGPMAEMMARVIVGALEDANLLLGYLQVGDVMRGSRIVIVKENTIVTTMTEIPLSELKIGDEVSVSGTPTALLAAKVEIGQRLSMADIIQWLMQSPQSSQTANSPTAPSAPLGPPSPAESPSPTSADRGPEGRPSALASRDGGPEAGPSLPSLTVSISGRVKSLEPFVIATESGAEMLITLPPDAVMLRREPADLSALKLGENLIAIGNPDENGYLVATRVYLGETLAMDRSGFGRRGGMMFGPMGAFSEGESSSGMGSVGPMTGPSETSPDRVPAPERGGMNR
ncbi:MAG: hypothetical protein ACUVX8_00230 [Candidatus Zipacnadales bacterium]